MLALSIVLSETESISDFWETVSSTIQNTLNRILQKNEHMARVQSRGFSTLKSKVGSMWEEDEACAVIFGGWKRPSTMTIQMNAVRPYNLCLVWPPISFEKT